MTGHEALNADRCQEQRYIELGRWGEWRPCDKLAKYEVVATSGGSGFSAGDTIHVCGIHKRKHEQRAEKDADYRRRRQESDAAREAANDRCRRLGVGQPRYVDFATGYSGGVILTAEETDKLLAELDR